MKAPMYRTAGVLLAAKIKHLRLFLITRHVKHVVHKLVYTFIFRSGNRHYGNSEQFLHLIHEHRAAVLTHLIHHI